MVGEAVRHGHGLGARMEEGRDVEGDADGRDEVCKIAARTTGLDSEQ